jgi:branched-chain amino acid transport system permease protein
VTQKLIEELLSFIVSAVIQGSIYSLLALGFSLVYGVGGILNQAHGAFYVIATYIMYVFINGLAGVGFTLGLIFSLGITTAIGGLIYILLIKPLKDSHVSVVIVTFAFAFFIEYLAGILVDRIPHKIEDYFIYFGASERFFTVFGVDIQYQEILIFIVATLLVILITVFIKKSKLGKSIRAVAQDSEAAELMGINVDKILAYTLMISAFLAAIAAIINGPLGTVTPYAGWPILINSFAIVVLGGLGSLPGSVLGAYILAFASRFTQSFINPIFGALIPIVVIVIMLIIRPRGIFGKKEID